MGVTNQDNPHSIGTPSVFQADIQTASTRKGPAQVHLEARRSIMESQRSAARSRACESERTEMRYSSHASASRIGADPRQADRKKTAEDERENRPETAGTH